jgi:hypothetical protein
LLDLSLECGIARQQQALNLLESGTNATKYHAMLCGDCFYLYNWKTEKNNRIIIHQLGIWKLPKSRPQLVQRPKSKPFVLQLCWC